MLQEMSKKLLLLLFLALLVFGFSASNVRASGLTGAIFTTDSICTGVNLNIYSSKGDVYLDGGPAHPGAAGLPDGEYYVQATEPNGTPLGTSIGSGDDTPIVVAGGEFATCYQLSAILIKASDSTAGYDDTSNPGGEYKVWVSTDSTFPNNLSKTDNFKVEESQLPPETAELHVRKFYDANANGIFDGVDQPIPGWKIHIQDTIDYIRYTPVNITLDPDDYIITEFMPIELNWIRITTNPVNITLDNGDDETVTFGNYCLVPSGGLSKGFWTNKNGQALFNSNSIADLADLVTSNLRNAKGLSFDPTTYTQFKTWLGLANATNMAYMLSAQLATMKLNILHDLADPNAFYIPAGKTIGQIVTDANTSLGLYSITLSGIPQRVNQETLKNYLDALNNGASVIPTTPCFFSFAD